MHDMLYGVLVICVVILQVFARGTPRDISRVRCHLQVLRNRKYMIANIGHCK